MAATLPRGGLDMTGQLTPTRRRPDGLSPASSARPDSTHAVGHEAVSRAPAGGGLATDLIREQGQALRSLIADVKLELTTRINVVQENNDQKNNKYINKQTLKEDETSNDIKKEDAATTHQASQTGCQDAGSGPVSSKSIPIRELVPHHEGHGLLNVQGSVGALARVLHQEQAPGAEG